MNLASNEAVAPTTSTPAEAARASPVTPEGDHVDGSVKATPSGELADIAKAVLEDHAELDRTVTRLRELCVSLGNGRVPADVDPAGLIEEFEEQLILHLAAEEAEEFFGSLVTEEPRLLGRVASLQTEHGEMADVLDHLVEFARGRPPDSVVAARLTEFLDRFDAHEQAENALMQEFFLLDEGGSN